MLLELNIKIRDLQIDKLHLQQQCEHLQQQLQVLQNKSNVTGINYGKDVKGNEKIFVLL